MILKKAVSLTNINLVNIPIFKNSFTYGLGDLIQKSILFFLIPIYSSYISTDEYGVLGFLLVANLFTQPLLGLGLTNGVARFFFTKDKKNNINKNNVVWSPFIFSLSWSSILLVFLINFSDQLSVFLFDQINFTTHIKITFFTAFFLNITSFNKTILTFEEKPWLFNAVNISNVLILTLSAIILIIYMELSLLGLLYSYLIASIFTSLCLTFRLIKNYKIELSKYTLHKQISYSLPLMISVFSFWIIDSSSVIIQKYFINLTQIGLYTIGSQFGFLILLVVSGISSAWPPYYFKNYVNSNSDKISNYLIFFFQIACLAGFLISILSPIFFKILISERYYDGLKIIPFITSAYILRIPYLFFLVSVISVNKTKQVALTEISTALICIVLNIIFLPIFGFIAGAISIFISNLILCVLFYFLSLKYKPISNLELKIFFYCFSGTFFLSLTGLIDISNYFELNLILGLISFFLFIFLMYKPIKDNYLILTINKKI